MSELRRRLLDELHQRVERMADAPFYDLHRQLAEVIAFADRISPTKAAWAQAPKAQRK